MHYSIYLKINKNFETPFKLRQNRTPPSQIFVRQTLPRISPQNSSPSTEGSTTTTVRRRAAATDNNEVNKTPPFLALKRERAGSHRARERETRVSERVVRIESPCLATVGVRRTATWEADLGPTPASSTHTFVPGVSRCPNRNQVGVGV